MSFCYVLVEELGQIEGCTRILGVFSTPGLVLEYANGLIEKREAEGIEYIRHPENFRLDMPEWTPMFQGHMMKDILLFHRHYRRDDQICVEVHQMDGASL